MIQTCLSTVLWYILLTLTLQIGNKDINTIINWFPSYKASHDVIGSITNGTSSFLQVSSNSFYNFSQVFQCKNILLAVLFFTIFYFIKVHKIAQITWYWAILLRIEWDITIEHSNGSFFTILKKWWQTLS